MGEVNLLVCLLAEAEAEADGLHVRLTNELFGLKIKHQQLLSLWTLTKLCQRFNLHAILMTILD